MLIQVVQKENGMWKKQDEGLLHDYMEFANANPTLRERGGANDTQSNGEGNFSPLLKLPSIIVRLVEDNNYS